MEEVSVKKAELRDKMLGQRKKLNLKQKRSYDQQICEKLKKLILIKEPVVVHAYLPIKQEIDITPLLSWLLNKKITVVCPKVLPKRQLENLELLNLEDFDRGPFNTIHPAGNKVFNGDIDFVIMPGLAFYNDHNRLVYGGGYYDRFLVKHPASLKAAICYPFQLIDKVPVEDHDIRMDRIVLIES